MGTEPPSEYLFEGLRKVFSHSWQFAQLDRVIQLRSLAERNREDDEVGAPGHALRVELVSGNILSGKNACHRRAVRELVSNLIVRAGKEPLDDGLVPERGICAVNARIQNADGHALAGRSVGAELQFEIRVGLIGTDRFQSPLVLEARLLRVFARDFLNQRFEFGFENATLVMSLDACHGDIVQIVFVSENPARCQDQGHGTERDRNS